MEYINPVNNSANPVGTSTSTGTKPKVGAKCKTPAGRVSPVSGTEVVAWGSVHKRRSSSVTQQMPVKILAYTDANIVAKDAVGITNTRVTELGSFHKSGPKLSYTDFTTTVMQHVREVLPDARHYESSEWECLLLHAEIPPGGRKFELTLLTEKYFDTLPLEMLQHGATCLQLVASFKWIKCATSCAEELAMGDTARPAAAVESAKKKKKKKNKTSPKTKSSLLVVLDGTDAVSEDIHVVVMLRVGVETVHQPDQPDRIQSKTVALVQLRVTGPDIPDIMDVSDARQELLPILQKLLDNKNLHDHYELVGDVFRFKDYKSLDLQPIEFGEELLFQKTPAPFESQTRADYVLLVAVGNAKNATVGRELQDGMEYTHVGKKGNGVGDKIHGKMNKVKLGWLHGAFFDQQSKKDNLHYKSEHVKLVVWLQLETPQGSRSIVAQRGAAPGSAGRN
jgi:hypothetical protein